MAVMATMRCCPATMNVSPCAHLNGVKSSALGLPAFAKLGPKRSSVEFAAVSLRQQVRAPRVLCRAKITGVDSELEVSRENEEPSSGDSSGFYEKALLGAVLALSPLLDVENANAAGGELGLLEGRSFALLHPLVMGGLFLYTLYAGYLGWQWRRVRTIQTEINELKKQVVQVAVPAGEKFVPPASPSPVEAQISSLTEERKQLVKGGFKDKHFNAGSILLALGVLESVGGAVNTWFRTGKLFPGPHLFAGAGITVCWALAAALVPAMQKGDEGARNLHIGLNLINVFLFVWQIPTGLEIVGKVFEFTSWP